MKIFTKTWFLLSLFACLVITMASYAVVECVTQEISIAATGQSGSATFDVRKSNGKILVLRATTSAIDSGDSITLTLSDNFISDYSIYTTTDVSFAANTPEQYTVSDGTTTYYAGGPTKVTFAYGTPQVAASTVKISMVVDTEP